MRQEIGTLHKSLSELSEPLSKALVRRDLDHLHKRLELIKNPSGSSSLPEADMLRNFSARVSIIIINRNGFQKLKTLMNSFSGHVFYDNFEIIFIDNASTDDSVAYMQTWQEKYRIKIIRNTENMSFSAANNLGVRESSGEYVLFLNNDTEVTDGWLDELIIAILTAENPGSVGAKLVYPHIPEGTVNFGKSYRIQHTGIAFRPVIWNGGFLLEPYNTGNGDLDDDLNEDPAERAGVTAAVLLMKRSVFEEIGGFDEAYFYGYEDVDLGLRLLRAGYKNYYCPTCLLYHYEFGTQQKDSGQERSRRGRQNLTLFKEKWQDFLCREILTEKLRGRSMRSERPLTIALAAPVSGTPVSEQKSILFRRFWSCFEQLGYETKIIHTEETTDPYDIGLDADVLCCCEESFDLMKIRNARPNLIKIACTGDVPARPDGYHYIFTADEMSGAEVGLPAAVISFPADLSAEETGDLFVKSLLPK